jgi:hypothetical protein
MARGRASQRRALGRRDDGRDGRRSPPSAGDGASPRAPAPDRRRVPGRSPLADTSLGDHERRGRRSCRRVRAAGDGSRNRCEGPAGPVPPGARRCGGRRQRVGASPARRASSARVDRSRRCLPAGGAPGPRRRRAVQRRVEGHRPRSDRRRQPVAAVFTPPCAEDVPRDGRSWASTAIATSSRRDAPVDEEPASRSRLRRGGRRGRCPRGRAPCAAPRRCARRPMGRASRGRRPSSTA